MEKNKKIELPEALKESFALTNKALFPSFFFKGKRYHFGKLTAKQAEFLASQKDLGLVVKKTTSKPETSKK